MKIGHEMIRASAGSGKTYALTNRFVRLLALGVEPERIVALTFTRKAAGEFLDAILRKLADCAASERAASRLGAELGLPVEAATPANFRRLLRAVVDSLHRLRLGTLDGFFMEIAQSFALEIGLGGRVELLEAHAEEQTRMGVLGRLFAESHGRLSAAQQEFLEAFKEATYGQEAKRVADQLAQFIKENQELFLDEPEAGPPDLSAWLVKDYPTALGAGLAALRDCVVGEAWDEKRRQWWAQLFDELEHWAPGSKPRTPLENVLKALPEMAGVTMAGKRGVEVSGQLRAALLAVTRAVIGGELARRVAMTRGVYAVLAAYEAVYDAQVRRAGRLTFADVTRLLAPASLGTELGQSLSEAASIDAEERRLLIDYRLDAQIDHWMLDEFQDTNFGQWSILKNLIDEVVQDPDGRRSFFYVGDVKQSIYAFRGGDPGLFGEVFAHYHSAADGGIIERHLDESWRSGPPIIEMVNHVFGAAVVLEALFAKDEQAGATVGVGAGGGVHEWNAQWREHRSARPELGGHAALLLAEAEGTDKEAGKRARFEATLAILRELPRPSAEFSIAVLVQSNAVAAELADSLRSEGGIEAVAEADLHVCTDNPVGAALLARVQAAAHPGDRLARAHVAASPVLGAELSPLDLAEPLFGLGPIIERLEPQLAGDAFSRLRLRQWGLAAAEFEESGSRDPDEFIAFMRRYTLREPDSAGVVRVMTIHKSKGLGFDAVILPDLQGDTLAQARKGLAVKRDAKRQVEWVLDLPRKEIVEQVSVLADYLREAKAEGLYDKLSLLYVAMTRAKRALYAIIEMPKPKSDSRNFPKLLMETLGADEPCEVRVGSLALRGAWEAGDFGSVWAKAAAAPEEAPPAWPVRVEGAAEPRFPGLVARRPSDQESGVRTAEQLFAPSLSGASDAGSFGREVHRLFARAQPDLFWRADVVGTSTASPSESEEVTEAEKTVDARARALVAACLAAPALAQVWARRPSSELWRERRFEAVIDGQWITGVFDRVIVDCAESGEPLRAEVYDFKTDEDTAGAALRHAPQLALYRAAVAQLTGLPREKVRSFLVLTKTQELVEVGL